MPQIWPMNWVFLFLLFTLTFIMYLNFTYFIPKVPCFSNSSKVNQVSTLNWKW